MSAEEQPAMLSSATIIVAIMALLYGYLADHVYTVWREGRIPLGMSRCDACGHLLSWEMTPILGYLATHGRCWRNDCELVVPPAYPLVEIVGVLIGILAATVALRATSVPDFLASFFGGFAIAYTIGIAGALVVRKVAPPRDLPSS